MQTNLKEARKVIIGFIFVLGSFYYVLENVPLSQLSNSFADVNFSYCFPTVALLFFSYWARAYRWKLLLLPFKSITTSEVYFTMMTGFLGNALPLRAGDFLRAFILKGKHGISLSGIFATILMEWLLDIILLLFLFTWAFNFHSEAFKFSFLETGISTQEMTTHFGRFCMIMTTGLTLFVYLFLQHKQLFLKLINWLSCWLPQKWNKKLEVQIDNFSLGFSSIKNYRILLQVIFYSILEWLLTILSFIPLFLAYSFDTPSFDYLVILTVMIVIFTTALPTPGFIGSFNAGIYVVLHHFMDKPEVLAANFGIVAWILNFLVILISGSYFIFKYRFSFKTIWKPK